ncbi:MAG: hypothetical protein RJQ04_03100 [Longimicrobiales bacterium]
MTKHDERLFEKMNAEIKRLSGDRRRVRIVVRPAGGKGHRSVHVIRESSGRVEREAQPVA